MKNNSESSDDEFNEYISDIQSNTDTENEEFNDVDHNEYDTDENIIEDNTETNKYINSWDRNEHNYYNDLSDDNTSLEIDDLAFKYTLNETKQLREEYLKRISNVDVDDFVNNLVDNDNINNIKICSQDESQMMILFDKLKRNIVNDTEVITKDITKYSTILNKLIEIIHRAKNEAQKLLVFEKIGTVKLMNKGFYYSDFLLKLSLWASMCISLLVIDEKLFLDAIDQLLKCIMKFEYIVKRTISAENAKTIHDKIIALISVYETMNDVTHTNANEIEESNNYRSEYEIDECNNNNNETYISVNEINNRNNIRDTVFSDNRAEFLKECHIKYELIKKRNQITKADKIEKNTIKKLSKLPQLPAKLTTIEESRPATKEMMKNRGLTRIRKKHSGHARVHNREKYRKKLIKLSSHTRSGDPIPSSGIYHGESRGISVHVTKGRKIN